MIIEVSSVATFLLLGLGLGMLHAFDPDHVAAVGGMSSGHQKYPVWLFSLHWSLGHGSALIFVALFVFLLGSVMPENLSLYAEKSVGFVLVLIGGLAMYRIIAKHYSPNLRASQQSLFAAPVVGLLHGTAGSAPLLALIPLAQLSKPAVGVFYVLFFSLGVLIAMMGFGLFISYGFKKLNQLDAFYLSLAQAGLALFSLIFGFYLILQH